MKPWGLMFYLSFGLAWFVWASLVITQSIKRLVDRREAEELRRREIDMNWEWFNQFQVGDKFTIYGSSVKFVVDSVHDTFVGASSKDSGVYIYPEHRKYVFRQERSGPW